MFPLAKENAVETATALRSARFRDVLPQRVAAILENDVHSDDPSQRFYNFVNSIPRLNGLVNRGHSSSAAHQVTEGGSSPLNIPMSEIHLQNAPKVASHAQNSRKGFFVPIPGSTKKYILFLRNAN